MKNVLIADDHGMFRTAFSRMLDATPDISVVAEAATGEEAIVLYRKFRPDVAVIDLAMPGIGGTEAIRKIMGHDPDAKLLVLTAYTEAVVLQRVLAAGALGLLSKACDPEIFFAAINTVARGKQYIEQAVAQKLAFHSLQGGISPIDQLTDREYEITRLIASGKRSKEIAELLHLSPQTVSTYLSHVYAKLGIDNAAALTRIAIRNRIVADDIE